MAPFSRFRYSIKGNQQLINPTWLDKRNNFGQSQIEFIHIPRPNGHGYSITLKYIETTIIDKLMYELPKH